MGENVTFPSNGSTCDGYLATPPSGSGPGLIVIQEWWGLVGHITDVADRFAAEGFVALAPDLYHGEKASLDEPDEAGKLMMGLAMDRAARDIAGAAAYLSARDDVTGQAIGTVGFCMGGSLALWSAALAENVQAAVGFYPAVPWDRIEPDWSGAKGKAFQIHAAEHDNPGAPEGREAAKGAIEAAGGTVEIFEYPGTQHAFFNDQRADVHDPAAARTAWDRTLEHLRHHLG